MRERKEKSFEEDWITTKKEAFVVRNSFTKLGDFSGKHYAIKNKRRGKNVKEN